LLNGGMKKRVVPKQKQKEVEFGGVVCKRKKKKKREGPGGGHFGRTVGKKKPVRQDPGVKKMGKPKNVNNWEDDQLKTKGAEDFFLTPGGHVAWMSLGAMN